MRYKRQESLRYTFPKPIKGTFIILLDYQDQDKLHKTDAGELEVIDLSPGGIKFSTHLDLPLKQTDFLVDVSFPLAKEEVNMKGHIVWKKEQVHSFHYGLEGIENEEKEQEIIELLKKLHAGNTLESTLDIEQQAEFPEQNDKNTTDDAQTEEQEEKHT